MFYKVVCNGTLLGQDIRNTFYYRTGVGVDIAGLSLGGAEQLAQEFYDEVWRAEWHNLVSNKYMLETIEVYPINDLFKLVYSLPYVKSVNEEGSNPNQVTSPAACVNVRFNLEAQVLGPNIIAPKRGYVAIAGITEDMHTDGLLNTGLFDNDLAGFKKLGKDFSQNVNAVIPPVSWFPIRVRLVDNPLSDAPLFIGFADIKGATVQRAISWRRSRKPE